MSPVHLVLTSLEGVDAVFVLAGQDNHRPPEPAASRHLLAAHDWLERPQRTSEIKDQTRQTSNTSASKRYRQDGSLPVSRQTHSRAELAGRDIKGQKD